MGKFLLWAGVILVLLLVSRIVSHHKANARPSIGARRPEQPPTEAESMVRCAHCQIHLPRSEAYYSRGQTWCSAEHARMGLKK